MRAVILAAGLSSRLHPLTSALPKTLLPVAGRTIHAYQRESLRAAGIDDVTVVTGFRREVLEPAIAGAVELRHFPDFATTGNLATLHHVRDRLEGEVVVLFSDLLFGCATLLRALASAGDIGLVVDGERSIDGTMRVRRDGERIVDVGPHIPVADGNGSFIGLARLSAAGSREVRDVIERLVRRPEMRTALWTEAVRALIASGGAVEAVLTAGDPWIEVDTPADYERAQAMARQGAWAKGPGRLRH
jgi:choline kinase